CAQIIYDRFHIAKHLNDTMNHVRIHVFNRLRKGDSAEHVHTGYKMLENTDLKLSVFQHFFILVSY
ncbi:transposase, partial [Limosilactobacillus reuteri]